MTNCAHRADAFQVPCGVDAPQSFHFQVRVVSSSFNDTLYDTIDLLLRTDVFLGMHGAGFTNIQFIPKARPWRGNSLQ